MRYLFNEWQKIKDALAGRQIFLFLDYDGTIVPLASTPDRAIIPAGAKRLLQQLSKKPNLNLAIISGRALGDLKNMVGIRNITYSGNHGLEIVGPRIKYQNRAFIRYRPLMKKIYRRLSEALSGIKGVLIENKGLSLSVHYRLVDKHRISEVKALVYEALIEDVRKNKIRVRLGKMVFEITPPIKWDKGKIVLWLLTRAQAALGDKEVYPIYIGDDTTDEDAFRSLRNRGLTVAVGRGSGSHAKYYLCDTREVIEFLRKM